MASNRLNLSASSVSPSRRNNPFKWLAYPLWLVFRTTIKAATTIATTTRASRDVLALAALFATSGTMHFVKPRHFESIVPHQLPFKRALVYVSGVTELACSAGLLTSRTHKAAGLASAALLVAVFPANVQMAVNVCRSRGRLPASVALLRLPVQLPMIRTAWRAGRT